LLKLGDDIEADFGELVLEHVHEHGEQNIDGSDPELAKDTESGL